VKQDRFSKNVLPMQNLG